MKSRRRNNLLFISLLCWTVNTFQFVTEPQTPPCLFLALTHLDDEFTLDWRGWFCLCIICCNLHMHGQFTSWAWPLKGISISCLIMNAGQHMDILAVLLFYSQKFLAVHTTVSLQTLASFAARCWLFFETTFLFSVHWKNRIIFWHFKGRGSKWKGATQTVQIWMRAVWGHRQYYSFARKISI